MYEESEEIERTRRFENQGCACNALYDPLIAFCVSRGYSVESDKKYKNFQEKLGVSMGLKREDKHGIITLNLQV